MSPKTARHTSIGPRHWVIDFPRCYDNDVRGCGAIDSTQVDPAEPHPGGLPLVPLPQHRRRGAVRLLHWIWGSLGSMRGGGVRGAESQAATHGLSCSSWVCAAGVRETRTDTIVG